MMRAIVREGDSTTHDGVVQESFPMFDILGRKVAGVGHRGHCPRCKKDFVIVAGARQFSYFGVNVAVEGMATSCGALLIASQHQATIDDSVGPASVEKSCAEILQKRAPQSDASDLEYYFAIEREDGSPASITYRVDSLGKKLYEGKLDTSGETIAFPMSVEGDLIFWTTPR